MPVGTPAEATAVNIVTTAPTTVLNGIINSFDDADMPDALRGNQISPGSANVIVRGDVNITLGAGVTAVVAKCFNNAGTQVGLTKTTTVTASTTVDLPFTFRDTTPRTNNVYSIQLTCTGATANSTVNDIIASADMPG